MNKRFEVHRKVEIFMNKRFEVHYLKTFLGQRLLDYFPNF